MIEIRDIEKSFGEQHVLKGITARFEAGKTSLIMGRSGSGKTVLIKCMVGLLEPDSGHVFYDDRDFFELSNQDRKKVRQEIGFLFQGSALFDSMTVEENVGMPLDMFTDWSKTEKLDRVNSVLERVSLIGANDKYPSEISGGMAKRVGIARAIALRPKYLFCDEPNSGLDPKTSLLIDELIKRITVENQITTIINTHDMNSVMEIGENIILLYNGELAWQGNKDEVLHNENQLLQDFIFASPFLQRLRNAALHNTKL